MKNLALAFYEIGRWMILEDVAIQYRLKVHQSKLPRWREFFRQELWHATGDYMIAKLKADGILFSIFDPARGGRMQRRTDELLPEDQQAHHSGPHKPR